MRVIRPIIILTLLSILLNKSAIATDTVESVDINKYMGQWYEIASIPMRFQKDCVGTNAIYKLLDNGEVEISNSCRKLTLDGELDFRKGRGRVVDTESNSKLEISFVGPFIGDTWFFWADYWILELGENYEYAVIGTPSKKFLWILSREKTLDQELYNDILERRQADGFNVEQLKKTLQ